MEAPRPAADAEKSSVPSAAPPAPISAWQGATPAAAEQPLARAGSLSHKSLSVNVGKAGSRALAEAQTPPGETRRIVSFRSSNHSSPEPRTHSPGQERPERTPRAPAGESGSSKLARWLAQKRAARENSHDWHQRHAKHIFTLNVGLRLWNRWASLLSALGLLAQLIEIECSIFNYEGCNQAARTALKAVCSAFTLGAAICLTQFHVVRMRWLRARGALGPRANFLSWRVLRPYLLELLVLLVHALPGVDIWVELKEELRVRRYPLDVFFAAAMLIGRAAIFLPRYVWFQSLVYSLEAWVLAGVVGVDVTPWFAFKVMIYLAPFQFVSAGLLFTLLVTAWGVRAFEQSDDTDFFVSAVYYSVYTVLGGNYAAVTRVGQVFTVAGGLSGVCLVSLLTAALIQQLELEPAEERIVDAVVGNSIRKDMLHAQISLIQWSWRRHFVQRLELEPELRARWAIIEASALPPGMQPRAFLGRRLPSARSTLSMAQAVTLSPKKRSSSKRTTRASVSSAAVRGVTQGMDTYAFMRLPLSAKDVQATRYYTFYLGEFRRLRRTLKGMHTTRGGLGGGGEALPLRPAAARDGRDAELDTLRAELATVAASVHQLSTDLHVALKMIGRQSKALTRALGVDDATVEESLQRAAPIRRAYHAQRSPRPSHEAGGAPAAPAADAPAPPGAVRSCADGAAGPGPSRQRGRGSLAAGERGSASSARSVESLR